MDLTLNKAGQLRNHAFDCAVKDDEVLGRRGQEAVKRLWYSLPSEVAVNHEERRWLLYEVVEQLEPEAHSASVLDYVRHHHRVSLSLVRIYVDLEYLVAKGCLSRDRRTGPNGSPATFYWETTGKLLVEPARPKPKINAAEAPLHYEVPHRPADIAATRSTRSEAALLTGQDYRTMSLDFAYSGWTRGVTQEGGV